MTQSERRRRPELPGMRTLLAVILIGHAILFAVAVSV
jgi:hypothetical protein